MQPLSSEQAALLEGDELEVSAGCEVLNLDLTPNTTYGDISDDLVGGTVSWNGFATIHRTCRIQLSRELPWSSVLVRLYMVVNGQRWNVGVFALTTPERPVWESPVTFDVQGYDLLYLLDRKIGEDYSVTSGTSYYDGEVQVFTDAGLSNYLIDASADDLTLPADRDWPLVARTTDPNDDNAQRTPVTFLRAANDLALAINFAGVWADENGLLRVHRYQDPASRAAEHTFNADDQARTVVGEQRTVMSDQWQAPNRWRFLWKNRPGGMQAVEGDGLYTVDNVDEGPTSQDARGGMVFTEVYEYEAASQAVLEELGDRRVAADLRGVTTVQATTGPWPVAGHNDVYRLVDSEAGIDGNVVARSWELDLTGGDTDWVFEVL